MANVIPGVAGGIIRPSRLLNPSTVADNTYLEASGATLKFVGVSQKGTRNTPYTGLDDGYAAITGETFHIFGPGETCPVQLGGTVAAGDFLTATTAGVAIATTTDGHFTAGWTMQAGVSGDIIEMFVQPGQRAS